VFVRSQRQLGWPHRQPGCDRQARPLHPVSIALQDHVRRPPSDSRLSGVAAPRRYPRRCPRARSARMESLPHGRSIWQGLAGENRIGPLRLRPSQLIRVSHSTARFGLKERKRRTSDGGLYREIAVNHQDQASGCSTVDLGGVNTQHVRTRPRHRRCHTDIEPTGRSVHRR